MITSAFFPLFSSGFLQLPSKLNADFVRVSGPVSKQVCLLGVPCRNERIVADGNCFFRAISQAVRGSQKHHRKIRLAVCKELEKNADKYKSILRSEYSSVAEYIQQSRMRAVKSWATEVEIQVTADWLGVSVYTFNDGRWLKYNCSSKHLSAECIYLENIQGNHFENVVCVCEPGLQSCYGYCKVNEVTGYSIRSRLTDVVVLDGDKPAVECNVEFVGTDKGVDVSDEAVQGASEVMSSGRSLDSKYVRQKRGTHEKMNILLREKRQKSYRKIYHEKVLFREREKSRSVEKYSKNISHSERIKTMSVRKYKENIQHRERVKARSVSAYKVNIQHRERVKARSVSTYKENIQHRERVKARSVSTYRQNIQHREKTKEISREMSRRKYRNSLEHRQRVIASVGLSRKQKKERSKDFVFVMDQFLEKVKHGPDFVCCVCHRLLFRNQVLSCDREVYSASIVTSRIADRCISEEYLHKCSEECVVPCQLVLSRGQLWICYTCHHKIGTGEMPAECWTNNLELDPIPPELGCLNSIEQLLIALHIPFMKMLALPKGGQNGVHGPVTCVPANIVQTTNVLPRSSMEGSLLQVKLKRKLTYKGHYEYQFVDTLRVRQALEYLKRTNVYYRDIEFNEEWINEFCRQEDEEEEEAESASEDEAVEEKVELCQDEQVVREGEVTNQEGVQVKEKPKVVDVVEESLDIIQDEMLHDRQQHCMFQDTCLMPVDIGQEALDQYFEDIVNIAPAEGNSPVRLLSDHTNDDKCFPVLFPLGDKTFYDNRSYHLTLSRYFNNRIMHADGRFARNVEYIFFAQYMSEMDQVVSSVSVALRKGKGGQKSQRISQVMLRDEESLKQLLEFDDGFRFLRPIRGTPAFWQSVQKDILACVRQLGIPTWFCSFSSADLRWQNLLTSILKQKGRTQTVEDLE